MKHCNYCNNDVADNAKHCPTCGRLLEISCSSCHQMIPNGSDFCPNCGAKTQVKIKKDQIKQAKDLEKEKNSTNFGLFILSVVVSVVVTVVFAPASVPFWLGAFIIYQNIKKQ